MLEVLQDSLFESLAVWLIAMPRRPENVPALLGIAVASRETASSAADAVPRRPENVPELLGMPVSGCLTADAPSKRSTSKNQKDQKVHAVWKINMFFWGNLGLFSEVKLVSGSGQIYTPLKINMEPKNHPIEKK